MPPRKTKSTKPRTKATAEGIAPTVVVSEERGVGRPAGTTLLQPDEQTLKDIESIGRVQLSYREAGAFFGVNHQTFVNFLDAHEKAREAYEKGLGEGKANLRRKQLQRALEDGSDTMLIWLGKQYLEQKDKSELGGADGAPLIQPIIHVSTTGQGSPA